MVEFHQIKTMNKTQAQVKEFHEKFNCVINDRPTIPDFETLKLRIRLISEELHELQYQGFGLVFRQGDLHRRRSEPLPDMEAIADGIGDLLYVTYGTAVSLGIDMEPIMDEIHRSNMSKVWPDGTVHRREDGKILKSPEYSPADIASLLGQQS